MSARIARGSAVRRPAAKSSGRKRRKKQAGLIESLPISAEAFHRLTLWAATITLIILLIATAFAFRLPHMAGTAIGEQIGAAGFTVRHIETHGLNRLDRERVYATVLDQPSLAMPLIDLSGIRERLLAFDWVREARVSRRLPDTLVVEIEERVPVAVWQHNRRLALIDIEGKVLEPVRLDAIPRLPLVIGPGAQVRVAELNRLLEAAPRLRPLIAGATWIGERRWDLSFHSGEVLALPEGEPAARQALERFAGMDERRQLLGGQYLRFDMRVAGRMVVRLRPGADGAAPTLAPPAPGQAPEEVARTI
jgi:cell division protein FtsQ